MGNIKFRDSDDGNCGDNDIMECNAAQFDAHTHTKVTEKSNAPIFRIEVTAPVKMDTEIFSETSVPVNESA
jgi:hypothetical protein